MGSGRDKRKKAKGNVVGQGSVKTAKKTEKNEEKQQRRLERQAKASGRRRRRRRQGGNPIAGPRSTPLPPLHTQQCTYAHRCTSHPN